MRQVFPTSGLRSTSLWDTTDIETLQLWLDEFLDADCTNEVFEARVYMPQCCTTWSMSWL